MLDMEKGGFHARHEKRRFSCIHTYIHTYIHTDIQTYIHTALFKNAHHFNFALCNTGFQIGRFKI